MTESRVLAFGIALNLTAASQRVGMSAIVVLFALGFALLWNVPPARDAPPARGVHGTRLAGVAGEP